MSGMCVYGPEVHRVCRQGLGQDVCIEAGNVTEMSLSCLISGRRRQAKETDRKTGEHPFSADLLPLP